jgi:hypothetical protein
MTEEVKSLAEGSGESAVNRVAENVMGDLADSMVDSLARALEELKKRTPRAYERAVDRLRALLAQHSEPS